MLLKFQTRVLMLSGWAMLMLILTLEHSPVGVSFQAQEALVQPLYTDVGGTCNHTQGYAQLDRTRQIWYS
jgi:uncharacterized protein (DUF169 family)